jgi:site-specific recombinase XerD
MGLEFGVQGASQAADSRGTPTMTTALDLSVGTPIPEAADDFERSMRAEARSPKTIKLYRDAINAMHRHLSGAGMPTEMESIRREHVESFVVTRLGQVAGSTANLEYRALRRFFGWAVDEDIIQASPLAKMHPPKLAVVPPPVLTPEQVAALIAACGGREFADKRDKAIIMLLADCGLRRAEVGNLRVQDVDRDRERVYVIGKGNKGRHVAYGPMTAKAIDTYVRARARHPLYATVPFFLGVTRRPFGPSGVGQVVARRGEKAGLGRINPHRFRHTYAHAWLADGGQEGDLMANAGWASRQMLQRYGASAAAERAEKAQHSRGGLARLGVKG